MQRMQALVDGPGEAVADDVAGAGLSVSVRIRTWLLRQTDRLSRRHGEVGGWVQGFTVL